MRIGGSGKVNKVQKIAKVAIIYSDDERQSAESRNLAHYFCGLLSASGYADMIMIPYNPKGPVFDLTTRRIMYIPPFKDKPLEVPVSSPYQRIYYCGHISLIKLHFTCTF